MYERILGSLDVVDFAALIAAHGNVYMEALDKLLEPLTPIKSCIM